MKTDDQEFRALYHEWMEAVQRRDGAALDCLLGEEYVYTASGQGRWSRQRWLEALAAYELRSFEFRRIDVRRYGDVAAAICDYRQEGAFEGAIRSGEFLITDVWVRRDGRWQVVARSSILATPA